MRMKLKVIRVKAGLTQREMAEKIGVSCPTYARAEAGGKNLDFVFWLKLQNAFNIPDEEMWPLVKNE